MKLFAKPARIYPKYVSGLFRSLKYVAMLVLLGIYYAAPFLRWDRGPHVPNQAILIDLVGQRGYFFGVEIWPQEVYLLVGVLILSAIGLFFATSLFGRVWCGYACPQTVWTDLFIAVERLFQGDRHARKKLTEGPITFNLIWRKFATHLCWLLIGLLTGGAWVLYFNDAPSLIDDIINFDVSQTVLVWIIALTVSTYIMAGYAREQVCNYMCPYARFQSAMFDKDTLVISYASERGEPRGKHKKGESWEGKGHCIDCDQCVQVCPAGIDIRDGLQYECISCGLCIDACDGVMQKVGLPKGLIHYDTENNQIARLQSPIAPQLKDEVLKAKGFRGTLRALKGRMKWFRPRSLAYFLILSAISGLMTMAIINRSETDLNIIHSRSPLYVKMSNGEIRNDYQIKILNKSHDDRAYGLKIDNLDVKSLTILGPGDEPISSMPVHANAVGEFRVQIKSKPSGQGRRDITFHLVTAENKSSLANGSVSTPSIRKASHDSYFIEP